MPRYCCIPYCTSNRPGKPYVSAFRFPKSKQLIRVWKEKIPREFEYTNDTVVCIKHFPESFIIRNHTFTDKDGNVREFARVSPKLANYAYPCIFPNFPTYSYLNEEVMEQSIEIEGKKEMEQLDNEGVKEQSVTIECKKEMEQLDDEAIKEQSVTIECKIEMEQLNDEEVTEQLLAVECKKEIEQLDGEEVKEQSVTTECKKEIEQIDDEEIKEQSFAVECEKEMEQLDEQENKNITFLNNNKINCLEYLKENLSSPKNLLSDFLTKNNILVHTCENCVSFLFVNCKDCPFIQKSLKVDKNLTINSFDFKDEINLPLFKKILSHPPKLTYFSELLNILTILNCFKIESHDADSIDLQDSELNSTQIVDSPKKQSKKTSAKHSRNVKKRKTR